MKNPDTGLGLQLSARVLSSEKKKTKRKTKKQKTPI